MIFIIASLIFLLDQASKLIIIQRLNLSESIPLIKNVFHLTLTFNTGAAFGILKDHTIIFIFISLLAIFLILINLRQKGIVTKGNFSKIALALILGGALGNLWDRLRYGYVVDFLDFRIWPVFNLADSAITVGAILLGWSILKSKA